MKKPRVAPEPETVPEIVAPLSVGDADDAVTAIMKILGPLAKAKDVLVTAHVAARDLDYLLRRVDEAQVKLAALKVEHAQEIDAHGTRLAAERQKRADEDANLLTAILAKRDALEAIRSRVNQEERAHREVVEQQRAEIVALATERAEHERFIRAARERFEKPVGA